jgi:hypothetical protein
LGDLQLKQNINRDEPLAMEPSDWLNKSHPQNRYVDVLCKYSRMMQYIRDSEEKKKRKERFFKNAVE